MVFVIGTDFREVGGPGNKADGGQTYSVASDADTLGTMMVSGYLDALAGKVNSQDTIILTGTDGTAIVQVTDTAGVITLATAGTTGIAATVTGNAAAVPITARSVDATTGGAEAMTLADGAIGQLLNFTLIVDGGDLTLTPATRLGYATITFADAGDSVQLEFKSGGWAVIGQGGVSTGPVVA